MVRSATATVAHCWGGYMLPEGLTEGEVVRLLEFDRGTYAVQCKDGRLYRLDATCVISVPSDFYSNHRAETFLKRMRALFSSGQHHSGLSISARFRHLQFSVYGDDEKLRGSLEIHKDPSSISGLSSERKSGDDCLPCEHGRAGPHKRGCCFFSSICRWSSSIKATRRCKTLPDLSARWIQRMPVSIPTSPPTTEIFSGRSAPPPFGFVSLDFGGSDSWIDLCPKFSQES
jgi:hypothetical protein